MKDLVKRAFRDTVDFLPHEFEVMSLSPWNESVLRYYFCRFLATSSPRVTQHVECDRIDLVLGNLSNIAFVEFKLYLHQRKFASYEGTPRGYKGGPGRKNLAEFQRCVDQLHEERCESDPPVSKYIVLVYADPKDGTRRRYASQYDDYRHPNPSVRLELVESAGPIPTTEGIVQARLYEVGRTA